jgi:hypothetical protein
MPKNRYRMKEDWTDGMHNVSFKKGDMVEIVSTFPKAEVAAWLGEPIDEVGGRYYMVAKEDGKQGVVHAEDLVQIRRKK